MDRLVIDKQGWRKGRRLNGVSYEPMIDEFRLGIKQRLYNWSMRAAREARGWRQQDLADATGIKTVLISRIETLRHYPGDHQAEAISTILGVTREALFPEWLRELRFQRPLQCIEDTALTLSEAQSLGLLSDPMLIEDGWEDKVETKVLCEGLLAQAPLTNRERRVLALRFGLDDGCSRTLEEVGKEMKVTRERIRAIEAKALRKLRLKFRGGKEESLR